MSAETVHRVLPAAPYPSLKAYRDRLGMDPNSKARDLGAERILQMLATSGLRGRGGAGFPTARKWQTIREHRCPTRFVVCNAAEGEPGTFKDRWLIRRNPYAVLDGMLIAAGVIGARSLYIGLKASFEAEHARLSAALIELEAAGALEGVEVHVVRGPEEYLYGEEKALLESMSGGEPLPREPENPPYEVGLFPRPGSPNPALVNNAQTFSHVPSILVYGPESFHAVGTADTPGTLLITLSGAVAKPGVFEVAAGITLRELLDNYGGGLPSGVAGQKLALAGVSAGAIPARAFDTKVDFAALSRIGSALGSGGFVVFSDATPAPRIAQMAARFLYVESCNQCSACKAGLRQASLALDALFQEDSRPGLVELAEAGARSAPQANRCYLPVQGAQLISSLIRHFPEEFDEAMAAWLTTSEPLRVPKMLDFDEANATFLYDSRQVLKQPDWTYAAEPEAAWM